MSYLPLVDSSSSSSEENRIFVNALWEAAKLIVGEEDKVCSQPRPRQAAINREREGAHERLVRDYFADQPVYTDEMFRRRFRMSRRLFVRIADDLASCDPYFTLRYDARGKQGFTTYQKCTTALRQLAYGTTSDSWDEYLRISERTSRDCLYKFCKHVVKIYNKKYLRKPNSNDIQKLYQFHHEKHGFSGMIGSIDCMHWPWKNFPNAWRGMFYRGDHGHPTIILEVVASQDLWIWHAFFGVPGSNNDLNVLNQSLVFEDVRKGTGPDSKFTVSGVEYKHGYYLADLIYPTYSTLVKTVKHLLTKKEKSLLTIKKRHERILNKHLGFYKQNGTSSQTWHVLSHQKKLRYCMYACILLMIIEDEGRAICEFDENAVEENTIPDGPEQQELNEFSLRNEHIHHHLQADLIEYIWNSGHDD